MAFVELTEHKTAGALVSINLDAIVFFKKAAGIKGTFLQLRDNSCLFVEEDYEQVDQEVRNAAFTS